jgi:N-acetyl-anhydromuramyl-L-alanine amidase AmpD
MRAASVALLALAGLLAAVQPADAAPPPWYPPLRWLPAAAQNVSAGRAGTPIDRIVIHATHGTYDGTLSWFRDPRSRLSAHYVIRASDGQVTQLVAEADTASHARGFNRRSIGIEHEFDPRRGIAFSDAQYRSSARLVCAITRRYGIPADRGHVIAHAEVPNTDHTDPGRTWDWSYFMRLVGACAGPGSAGLARSPAGAPAVQLSFGARSADVSRLQAGLSRLGYIDRVTGYFGPLTEAAVRRFQSAHGVPATGVYGPLTRAALNARLR